jgi:hypothetical protein
MQPGSNGDQSSGNLECLFRLRVQGKVFKLFYCPIPMQPMFRSRGKNSKRPWKWTTCYKYIQQQEIEQVMQHGVCGDRIIFAHPSKYPSHLTYAKKMGVKQMTVDCENELFKIKDFFPEAK